MNIQVKTLSKLDQHQGPEENFTGTVKVAMGVQGEDPSNISAGEVHFPKEARTAWHEHPRGQMLVITSGSGFVQKEGEVKQVIKKGDIVWIPPKVKHWHGASRDEAMSHIAIQESMNGTPVTWLEKVSDEQYE